MIVHAHQDKVPGCFLQQLFGQEIMNLFTKETSDNFKDLYGKNKIVACDG